MIPLLTLVIVLFGSICVLAYMLAIYALPLMVAVAVARFAYATGAGLIGAGIVGLFAGAAFFGVMACLFVTLRSPFLRFGVAVIFSTPAAIAGYALVYGLSREVVPSEIWRQVFSIAGGAGVGLSALARLADPSLFDDR
ncbi:hypothetical protein [Agrobacterium tumefaciens]|uniref:hypothetical protein n=1 Tax=Agrobacterium tumefaciens TaxID=358 RepID=UPI0015745B88|nr:hypothetical protein [Agrobacterium tumefaciens]